MDFIKELTWRGMIHTMMPGVEDQLNKEMTTAYLGIDPTADSLHIGHLVGVMMLRHFQRSGHRPVALVGGATGMIGDPSMKSQERKLIDEETLRHNQEAIKTQLSHFLDFDSDAPNAAVMVNNYDWMKDFGFLEFIRDIGKHITVNYMMAKDSVKKRLSGESREGMSFTEFSYQLLQGYDFLNLYRTMGCKVQLGGSDQWGNMTTGTELIRRIEGAEDAWAITCPLLDRIEVIEISGYLEEEKIEIAKRHILPRLLEQYGKTAEDLKITDEALAAVIENYTGESGVRQLEKHLAEIIRKMILRDKLGQTFPCPVRPEDLRDLLGVKPFNKDRYEGNDFAGVVTGLAWTEVGGEILLVETSLASGKGDKITLTGNLGNVMKESAAIALQWTKAHAAVLGIDTELFDKYSLHIHFPEGAIPKDGPSAGITMTTAIVSQYTQRQLRPRIAMTGEMTLRGKVLPVGGIKEKILAAKRAGITDIILSGENRKDIEDIEPRYITGLVFHYVDTMMQVLDEALLPNKVPGAINL